MKGDPHRPQSPREQGIIMSLSEGKLRHLKALSNANGVIAAAAMDQRGSLQKSIASGKGVSESAVTPEMMSEFKTAVVKVLTPHASAILLDPEFGLEAAEGAFQKRRSAAGLREKRIRQHAARTPARPAAARVREAHRGLGRRRSKDPDLLYAVRQARSQRHQACLHRADRSGMRRPRHSVLPGIRGI